MLRHMALNVMQKDTSKGSLRGKFMRAGWDEREVARLLTLFRNAIALQRSGPFAVAMCGHFSGLSRYLGRLRDRGPAPQSGPPLNPRITATTAALRRNEPCQPHRGMAAARP